MFSITVELDRRAQLGPDAILITAHVARDGVPGAAVVSIRAADDELATFESEPGTFHAEIVPSGERTALPIVVEADDVSVERVALVLTELDDSWGQPEAVPGMVNTLGYEDSSEISPDGQWLIVSDYSPVDAISCFLRPLEARSSACNTSLGPHDAPLRPDLPGADRILSPTEIDHTIPRLGMTPTNDVPWTGPLPPVAAYGFHKQHDGSFAEPFVIAFDAEGVSTAPFGIDFVGPVSQGRATIVYAWDDPSTGRQDADLHRATITLGQRNILGTMRGTFPFLTVAPPAEQLPQASFDEMQSNPFVAVDDVYFDQHGEPRVELDLWFLPGAWDIALGLPVRVALSQPDRTEYQPFEHASRLYFASSDATGDFKVIRSAEHFAGADPSLANSWGDERIELSVSGVDGELVAIGEPSLADDDGTTWMYFVYGKLTATGVDTNVARVRRRAP